MKMINLTIDGRAVQVPEGASILDAAAQLGIEIPTLCHAPELTVAGACRMCVVEVEKARNLPAACATPVMEGMVVHTESPRVQKARRVVLELMLANHPKDCLLCEKNGDCRLQDYAYRYQVNWPEAGQSGEVRTFPADTSNPFFIRDHQKCILCGKCVRVCQEVRGVAAIDYANRGFYTKIATAYDMPLQDSSCQFCGQCVDACPVGALTPKQSIGAGRSWEIRKVQTTCTYCGVGCSIDLHVKGDRVVGASASKASPANRGRICVKGKFGWDFIHRPERLTTPLVRKGGKKDAELVPASWEEALGIVARRLGEIKDKYGSDALAGLTSAKATNEENYLMQKLTRSVFGINNIDHCARLCHASTVAGLAMAFGSGAMTNSIDEIDKSDVILVMGSNTTEGHPVIGLQIKKALKNGATLIVADPRKIELAELAHLHLQLVPGTNVALLNGLMNVILAEGLQNQEFIDSRTEGFTQLKEAVAEYTPEYVEKITGVPAEKIRETARLYAKAANATILYAMGITQHTTGTDNVLSIANLAMLCGQIGRPYTGVDPLRGQNNVQGACDMGGLPNVYPGYQAVDKPENREKFEAAWGVKLSEKPGLTVTEIISAAEAGQIRGMYIFGENPMVSDPDLTHVEKALRKLDFLVVQDIFLTETAALADVVLPGVSFAEKDGTFTNTERRVQRVRQAIPPVGQARQDWEIIAEVAERMGQPWKNRKPADVMREMAALTPIYGGISHERLGDEGLQWPCPTPEHPGTPYLHAGKFSRGLGKFHAITFRKPAELPDKDYPFILTTGRILFHYHTGTLTRRSKGIGTLKPFERTEINPVDAEKLDLADGDFAVVKSRRGQVTTRVQVTERVPAGVVFMTFHFKESAANILTNNAVDPVAKIPEFKVAAVNVRKATAAEIEKLTGAGAELVAATGEGA